MRKPGQIPESYTPKKPEIARMMQEHAGNLIKETVTMADFVVRVIAIPPMTVAASHATGDNCEETASNALNRFAMDSGLLQINPQVRHFGFDCSGGQSGVGEASRGYEMWVSIPDDMDVPAPLIKRAFHGGLFIKARA